MGSKLANAQSKLKGVLNLVKTENPRVFDAASGQTSPASGQATLENICAAAVKTESTMTEYTCVFVAMTVVKNPTFSAASQAGETVRANLGQALATLRANRKTNISKTEVDEIQVAFDDVAGAKK